MSLRIHDLRTSYGATPALRGIDLVLDGGIVAMLGPNGSGKTTLLRCLATSLRPDAGEIRWRGRSFWPDPWFVRRSLGYLPQEPDFPHHLTPVGLLEHLGRLKGCHDAERNAALLTVLGLDEVANRAFATLSAGQVRLAGIAQALLGDPALLLLDEPTRGLDVEERERVFRQLRRLAARSLILFSTQVADDVTRVSRRVVVLKAGRVGYAGEAEALRRQAVGQVYEVRLPQNRTVAVPSDCRISRRGEAEGDVVMRLVGRVPQALGPVEVEPSLEDAYLLLLT